MKKYLMAVALAACLGGCVTTEEANNEITQIQQTAVTVCGFLPSVTTVARIVGAWTNTGAAVDLASAVAGAICDSVTKKSLRQIAAAPMVVTPNGTTVTIQGSFVR